MREDRELGDVGLEMMGHEIVRSFLGIHTLEEMAEVYSNSLITIDAFDEAEELTEGVHVLYLGRLSSFKAAYPGDTRNLLGEAQKAIKNQLHREKEDAKVTVPVTVTEKNIATDKLTYTENQSDQTGQEQKQTERQRRTAEGKNLDVKVKRSRFTCYFPCKRFQTYLITSYSIIRSGYG